MLPFALAPGPLYSIMDLEYVGGPWGGTRKAGSARRECEMPQIKSDMTVSVSLVLRESTFTLRSQVCCGGVVTSFGIGEHFIPMVNSEC